ncbi:Serine/threonine-protein kinase wnk4 [Trifolium repens]|nr:Serine/threonine-protein kinase wnk4 [Trifolium repens]
MCFIPLDFPEKDHRVASTRKEKHPIIGHKCTSFTHDEEQITLNQSKVIAGTQALSTSESEKVIENRILMTNKLL